MALSRHQENYLVMTVIYDELNDYTHGNGEVFRDARDIISELADCPYDEVSDYVKIMIAESLNHYGEIVSAFLPYLKDWKWDRLPIITRAILVMSYAHFYFVEKIDKKIVINVAVDLAKKYVDSKQAKFINAILDGVLK